MDVKSSTDITKITSRGVRARLRPVAERVHEERDPLGMLDASVIHERSDRPDPFDTLVEAMLPIVPKLGTAGQVVRNAAARRDFLANFPTLASIEVAKAAGSDAKNAAALATRWRKEHRVFAVTWGGELRYPAFQFDDDGRPLPAIKSVVDAFGVETSPWQVALWFVTPSPYLPREERPVRFLWHPDQLVAAARAERELPEF